VTATATRSYTVQGMTCDHCVASVSEEVGEIPGINNVDIELATGRLVVRGRNVSDAEVRAAVEEAGYRLAEDR
jgi:copper chaperone